MHYLSIIFQNFPHSAINSYGGGGFRDKHWAEPVHPNSGQITVTLPPRQSLFWWGILTVLYSGLNIATRNKHTHGPAELAPFLLLVLLGRGGVLLESTKSCEQGAPSLPHPVLAPGKGCI